MPGPGIRVTRNPVFERAELSYELERSGPVSCTVFDAAGMQVAHLVNGVQQAGRHSVAWDASSVAPGIYFAKLVANGAVTAARLTKTR